MITVLLLSLLLLLFPSCSPDNSLLEREIYLISVADDFYGKSHLENVISDQASLISQISTLDNVHVYSFTAQDGLRYTSMPTADNPNKTPSFKPFDKNKTELSSPSKASFKEFLYVPSAGETAVDWDMDDVIECIRSLESAEDDLIIFTYSGHGEEGTGALITNADRTTTVINDDDETTKYQYVTTNKEIILEALDSIPGNKILFLDSCYSGNFIKGNTLTTMDKFTNDEDRYIGDDYIEALKNSSLEKSYITYPNMWIMTASGRNQTAWDSLSGEPFQKHYGAFTYYLLKALGFDMENNISRQESSSLTFYSIYSYIRENFPELELSDQTPRSSLRRLDIRIR